MKRTLMINKNDTSNESSSKPTKAPNHPRTPLRKAIKLTNAKILAMIFPIRMTPWIAP